MTAKYQCCAARRLPCISQDKLRAGQRWKECAGKQSRQRRRGLSSDIASQLLISACRLDQRGQTDARPSPLQSPLLRSQSIQIHLWLLWHYILDLVRLAIMTRMLYIHVGDLQTENIFFQWPPDGWNQRQDQWPWFWSWNWKVSPQSRRGRPLSIITHFKSYHWRLATTSPSYPASSKSGPAIHTHTHTCTITTGSWFAQASLIKASCTTGRFHNAQVVRGVFQFKGTQDQ